MREETPQELFAVADTEEEAKQKLLDIIYQKYSATNEPIIRPKIPFFTVFLGAILPLLLVIANIVFFIVYPILWLFLAIFAFIILLFCKPTVIFLILLYQKFAPEKTRRKCRFTPSCSNYTLQAIRKYGLIKGGIQSVKRLLRCKPPNGGIDYL